MSQDPDIVEVLRWEAHSIPGPTIEDSPETKNDQDTTSKNGDSNTEKGGNPQRTESPKPTIVDNSSPHPSQQPLITPSDFTQLISLALEDIAVQESLSSNPTPNVASPHSAGTEIRIHPDAWIAFGDDQVRFRNLPPRYQQTVLYDLEQGCAWR